MTDVPPIGRIEVIDDHLAEVLRSKTSLERVQMIGAANRTAPPVFAFSILIGAINNFRLR